MAGLDGNGAAATRLPEAPPLLGSPPTWAGRGGGRRAERKGPAPARELWDRLFREGYMADVRVRTGDGVVPAHASVLGMASPVMKTMLKRSKNREGHRSSISIRGVPHQAVRAFIRFLYSSCYEQEDMNKFVLHLLVLSHVFTVPTLKQECVQQLEQGLLSVDNVADVFQLAQLCDAPRLCLICHRFILKNFEVVSATDGWKVMQQSNPELEKEISDSVFEAESKLQERLTQLEERNIYLQLHAVMEALVHICRDGCRTIGPHDKVLKLNQIPCKFPACKGIESLVRHFAGCKARVSGRCSNCRRMWQLLELHSCLCSTTDACKVPLCRYFKEKMQHQNKKDEMRRKLLANKIMEAKEFSRSPFTTSMASICASGNYSPACHMAWFSALGDA